MSWDFNEEDIRSVFGEDLDEFVFGGLEADIDYIFGKDFSTVVDEFRRYSPRGLEPHGEKFMSRAAPGYYFMESGDGVLLFDEQGKLAGGYLSCDLSIDAAHQGQGLGAELVLLRSVSSGGNPVVNLDTAAYSPAGLAAHESAWRLSQSILRDIGRYFPPCRTIADGAARPGERQAPSGSRAYRLD